MAKSQITVGDKVQIIGLIAIVISLLLVLFELQQSRRIAGAQLMAQQFDAITDRYLAVMGENAASIMAKACHQPETLTNEDEIVLDAYLNAQFLTIRRVWQLADFGEILTTKEAARSWTKGVFGYMFAFPQTDRWWSAIRKIYEPVFPEVVEIGDSVSADKGDQLFCKTYFDGWTLRTEALPDASISR
ncbi:MAG: hypothetical protein AAFO81_05035 [Pseudomonadota bacterium]